MGEGSDEKLHVIAQAIKTGKYRYTIHAAEQRIARSVARKEIEQVLLTGDVIEEYPDHHYGQACLVMGKTDKGRVLHVLCSLKEGLAIVTVYEPDLNKWEADLKTRRKQPI
jgi:hypothetical protein